MIADRVDRRVVPAELSISDPEDVSSNRRVFAIASGGDGYVIVVWREAIEPGGPRSRLFAQRDLPAVRSRSHIGFSCAEPPARLVEHDGCNRNTCARALTRADYR